jgi:hypothetical protein
MRLVSLSLALLLGLLAASPFATRRAVGSGEAYNYSLALADGVTQIRGGVLPPLVGQTEYAWNGRIHPLRDAPYLIYLAAGLDLITGHRLSFWELQNLSLGLSLVGAALACYGALRWTTRCPALIAAALAGIYVLSPGLLMAANVQDLFMTVHAAVYVPLAIGLALSQASRPQIRRDLALAAVLAAAWWAHPPVALWLTAAVGLIRAVCLLRHPSWREARGLGLALLAGAAWAAFAFASAGTLNSDVGYVGGHNDGLVRSSTEIILYNLRAAMPGSLLPVSPGVDRPGDLQLGYGAAALLIGAAALLVRRKQSSGTLPGADPAKVPRAGSDQVSGRVLDARSDQAAGPGSNGIDRHQEEDAGEDSWRTPTRTLLTTALVLLAFVLPIPGLTPWLWRHAPLAVHAITNVWPAQRLYLIVAGLAVMSGGWVARSWQESLGARGRWVTGAAIAALLGWTLIQARPFLRAGWGDRWQGDATRRSYASSNLDLTVTSYSFLGTPAGYIPGVADPAFEFRILRRGEEVASPLAATLRSAPVVARGDLGPRTLAEPRRGPNQGTRIVLQPHQRYVLTLDLPSVPRSAGLSLFGTTLDRYYDLSGPGRWVSASGKTQPTRSFVLWTDQAAPETVLITFRADEFDATASSRALGAETREAKSSVPAEGSAPPAKQLDSRAWGSGSLAAASGRPAGDPRPRFTLREVVPNQLPVEVTSLFPLRCVATAPEPGCRLETCRRFLSGYRATVNGREVPVTRSPLGNVQVPVPQGRSEVRVYYAGSFLLRAAFWLSVSAWAAGFIGTGVWLCSHRFRAPSSGAAPSRAGPRAQPRARRRAQLFAQSVRRHRRSVTAAAGLLAAAAVGAVAVEGWQRYARAVGPLYLRLLPPSDATGRTQALLSMGRPGAGTVILIHYLDDARVRLGADVWGQLYLSPPLPIDYAEAQELVVDGSPLYPLDHPAIRRLADDERDRLRRNLRLEWNGQTVLEVPRNAYESTVAQISIGRSTIGGSHAEPRFTGTLLESRRLPWPPEVRLAPGQAVQLTVPTAALDLDVPEPLLALGADGQGGLLTVTRRSSQRLEFAFGRPGGDRIDHGSMILARRDAGGDRPVTLRCAIGRSHGDLSGGDRAVGERIVGDRTVAGGSLGEPGTGEAGRPVASVEVNGRLLMGPSPERLIPFASPPVVRIGVNPQGWGLAPNRFTALQQPAAVVPAFDEQRKQGPVSLALLLPRNRTGRSEPLVVTGRPGAGDFIYVTYVDANHVRFGVDDWGRFARQSEVQQIDYGIPHLIKVSFGPLLAKSRPPNPSVLQVTLDHRVVFQVEPFTAYPTRPDAIAIGHNPIGGSTCESQFTGVTLLAFRSAPDEAGP